MANEERIVDQLKEQFPAASDTIRVQRDRRIWIDVPYSDFAGFFDYIVRNMNFTALSAITGLDEGDNLSVLYHIARRDGTLMNVKTSVPRSDPRLKSVMELFPAAVLYERELVDLLGFTVDGLPEGNRYPLVDDWPKWQYPLRKDWSIEMLEAQPKAPAEQKKEGE